MPPVPDYEMFRYLPAKYFDFENMTFKGFPLVDADHDLRLHVAAYATYFLELDKRDEIEAHGNEYRLAPSDQCRFVRINDAIKKWFAYGGGY